jgi:hypothetical protein
LHVVVERGYGVANAWRLVDTSPEAGPVSRIADLSAHDLRAFCDWDACIRTNGYGHICVVNDAGWEQCRACDGGADCNGAPMSQDDCVAHATDPGIAQCNVALVEECLLQRAIRLPSDSRVTQTCALSEQACAASLTGDLSPQAAAARHETDQVTIEECQRELAISAAIAPDAATVTYWAQQLSMWDGGLPSAAPDAAVEGGNDGGGD